MGFLRPRLVNLLFMLTFPRISRGRSARPAPAEALPVVDELSDHLPLVPGNGLRAHWTVGASGRPELSWAVADPDSPPGVAHLLPRLDALFPDEVRRSA